MTEFEEKSVSLSRFLGFCVFGKSLNLWCYHRYYCTLQLYFQLLHKLLSTQLEIYGNMHLSKAFGMCEGILTKL